MDTHTRKWIGYGFLLGALAAAFRTPFPIDTAVMEFQIRNLVFLTAGGIGGAILARAVLWLRRT